MKIDKATPEAMEVGRSVGAIHQPPFVRRWSSNNMMCVVEFDTPTENDQAEIDEIFAVTAK
jgi:hypothetical protein